MGVSIDLNKNDSIDLNKNDDNDQISTQKIDLFKEPYKITIVDIGFGFSFF